MVKENKIIIILFSTVANRICRVVIRSTSTALSKHVPDCFIHCIPSSTESNFLLHIAYFRENRVPTGLFSTVSTDLLCIEIRKNTSRLSLDSIAVISLNVAKRKLPTSIFLSFYPLSNHQEGFFDYTRNFQLKSDEVTTVMLFEPTFSVG